MSCPYKLFVTLITNMLDILEVIRKCATNVLKIIYETLN